MMNRFSQWSHLRQSKIPKVTWARLVSNLISPPIIWAIWAFPTAFRYANSQQQAFLWAAIYAILISLIPVVYVGWMVKIGKISDIHMQHRRERIRPFLVSIVCTTLAWWILRFMGAPPVLPLVAMISVVQIAATALITLVWQISMHTMSFAGLTMASVLVYGLGIAWLLVPLLMLVSAARYNLKRHTGAQLIAGTFVGAIIPVVMLMLFA